VQAFARFFQVHIVADMLQSPRFQICHPSIRVLDGRSSPENFDGGRDFFIRSAAFEFLHELAIQPEAVTPEN